MGQFDSAIDVRDPQGAVDRSEFDFVVRAVMEDRVPMFAFATAGEFDGHAELIDQQVVGDRRDGTVVGSFHDFVDAAGAEAGDFDDELGVQDRVEVVVEPLGFAAQRHHVGIVERVERFDTEPQVIGVDVAGAVTKLIVEPGDEVGDDAVVGEAGAGLCVDSAVVVLVAFGLFAFPAQVFPRRHRRPGKEVRKAGGGGHRRDPVIGVSACEGCLSHSDRDASGVGGETFFFGDSGDVCGDFGEGVFVEFGDAASASEVVAGEAGGPGAGAAGGEDVAGAGGVVTEGDGGVVAEERGAAVSDLGDQGVRVVGLDVEVFGGEQVGELARLVGIPDADQRPERFERFDRQIAAIEGGELSDEFVVDVGDEGFVPGDQDGGAGGVFGLGEEVGGDVVGSGGVVGDHDHFAGAGERIDVDGAVGLLLGEGDEQVSGADDFVDGGDTVAAVGEGGDGLGAAHPVDLVDAQFVTSREQVVVVGAERGGWGDDGDFFDPRDLGGDDGHQQRGRIGRGAAGDADADAAEGDVTLGQPDAGTGIDRDVGVEDRGLESRDVIADAADGIEEGRVGAAMGVVERVGRDPQRVG